jgi:outer membrane protein TolC
MAGGSRLLWGLCVGLMATVPAAPLAAQGRAVTLEEAIARALRVQPRMIQAQGQVRTADARTRVAQGAYLPNLTASASGADFFSESSRVDPTTGELVVSGTTTRSASTSLNTSLELFDGFRRANDLKAARANADAAAAGLVDARFQQELQTTTTFFDALAAQHLVRVREASLRRAEEQLSVSIARLRAGAATRSDSLRSLVGVGNAQLQLVNTQAQLATAEANLGRLIGETERVRAVDDTAFYRLLPQIDTAALRAEAVLRSPQVQAAEASYRAAQATLTSARSTYWPSITLSGSTSLSGNRTTGFRMLNQRQLSLGLSWQLFNRFNREQTVATQAVNVDVTRATYEEVRRQVLATLTTRLAELDAARLRIEITQRSVEAAQEDLRVQQERYRVGMATILEVLTATEQLTQAEVDAVNARFDYLRAKANIEALIGRRL